MGRAIGKLPNDCCYSIVESPVGPLIIAANDDGLHAVLWQCDLENEAIKERVSGFKKVTHHSIIDETCKQLREYFAEDRKAFDLPIAFSGTDFQQRVWQELLKIPYGSSATYEEQAVKLGDKKKVRAVGMANGMNPISIIVPCHRVVGKNGTLTGFAGGLHVKAYLLNLEKGTEQYRLC